MGRGSRSGREQLERDRALGERAPSPAPERDAGTGPGSPVLDLQRRAGNRATTMAVQAKLVVGPAGDRHEQEADRVAAAVTGGGAAPIGGSTRGDRLGGLPLDAATEQAIATAQGGGSPLPPGVQRSLGDALGADLSGVRVHHDSTADTLNRSLESLAFTAGRDIFFRSGAFRPESEGGQHLLAHELAHVVQQGAAPAQAMAVQAWPFGKEDPAKKAAEAQQKAQKKQQKANRKRKVKDSKAHEKANRKSQQRERKIGNETRAGLKEQMSGGDKMDPTRYGALAGEFQKLIEAEKQRRAELESRRIPKDVAELQAYDDIWLSAPPELRALRPMRGSKEEKLARETQRNQGEYKGQAVGEKSFKAATKHGTLLSKSVERFFDKEAERIQEFLDMDYPPELAEQMAASVWNQAPDDVLAKRPPMGSKLEAEARADARRRVMLGERKKEEKDTLDDVIEYGGMVGDPVSKVSQGVAGAGKLTKKLGSDGDKQTLNAEEITGGLLKEVSTLVDSAMGTFNSVTSFIKTVKQIEAEGADQNDAAKAIAEALGILKKAMSIANTGVRAAATSSEAAASALSSVIPILSLPVLVLEAAASTALLTSSAIRLGESDSQIYAARAAGRPELVLPIQRLRASNAKTVSKHSVDLGLTIAKMAASVAEIASGGGYGVPAAIKVGLTAAGAANSLAHTIADDILARQTQGARKGYRAKHEEGSAERMLGNDLEFSVDAIITEAKKGDPVAGQVVLSFGAKLDWPWARIHERIMSVLGEKDDPKTFFQGIGDKLKKIGQIGTDVSDKVADVNALAQARNAKDGKGRGFGWKFKMFFKGRDKLDRSIRKTGVETGGETRNNAGRSMRDKYGAKGGNDDGGVFVAVAKGVLLPPNPSQADIDRFVAAVEQMTEDELAEAAKAPYHAPDMQALFAQELRDRVKAGV